MLGGAITSDEGVPRPAAARWRGALAAMAVILPWLAAVTATRPWVEATRDDDWAYALTVRHLLLHHEYRLHDWATANMPAQIAWGAAFCAAFGFSFAALRLSTLTLLALALLDLARRLRHAGLAPGDVSVLLAVVHGSPLVFLLSLTFMTDVPFLATFTLAAGAYGSALRNGSVRAMALASALAAAAILTRQFGVALPIAVAAVTLPDRGSRRLGAAGLALPCLATLWQLWSMAAEPTAFMALRLVKQWEYLADPARVLANLVWRPVRIAQYVGLFAAPLLPILVWRASRQGVSRAWTAYVLGAGLTDVVLNGRPMPSLEGNLAAVLRNLPTLTWPVTAIALVGAVFAGTVLLPHRGGASGDRLPGLAAAALTVLHVAYADAWDEYLIVFLPLLVLAAGADFGAAPARAKAAAALLALATLLASTAWAGAAQARKAAFWRAAEAVHHTGVPAEEIYAAEWTYYRIGDRPRALAEYSPARIGRSSVLVWDPWFVPYRPDASWLRVGEESYRWIDGSSRSVGVYRRRSTTTEGQRSIR